jgi:hypothetical protein
MPGAGDNGGNYSVKSLGSLSTAHAAAVIVIAALVLLILIRKGFRGLTVPGVGSVKVGS